MKPLPKYQSHKVVEAAKISSVHACDPNDPGAIHTLYLETGDEVYCDQSWFDKHVPENKAVGGYYIRYPDGYSSWSPSKAFEEGYSLINAKEKA